MATRRNKRNTMRYESYGNVAYAPAVESDVLVAPRPAEHEMPLPKRRVQQREKTRTLTRSRAQVREAGVVAPFAVIGFLAVGVFAALFLLSLTQYTEMNDQVVALQNSYAAVQTENAALAAQYEQLFDIASIEAAIGDTMVRPDPQQVVYLDLSQPDQVVLFDGSESVDGVAGLVQGIQDIVDELTEYFK